MRPEIEHAVAPLLRGEDLDADTIQTAIGTLMDGKCTEVSAAALLTALRMKGESVGEIVGAARAMRERVTRINAQTPGLLDTCGTGGDELHTFNISTVTALIAAACGVPVAKHGNRSVSSSSGSADVLEALGVNIQLSPEKVAESIDSNGIGFCFAPLLHSAMRFVAPVRRELGFRTLFNLLGPLTNPASAEFQLVGVAQPQAAGKIAEALSQLQTNHAIVVCGNGELDEVSLWGETDVWFVETGAVRHERWTADTFGLQSCRVDDLRVESPEQSVAVIRSVLDGAPGPPRDIVLANAAAALLAARSEVDPKPQPLGLQMQLTVDPRQNCVPDWQPGPTKSNDRQNHRGTRS